MKLNTAERNHIKNMGARWNAALGAATMTVRTEPKLVGLDKIREPLAIQAALVATECPDRPDGFVMPVSVGQPTAEILDITSACFNRAVKASRVKLVKE